jgi:hypothetical protein
VNYLFRKIKSCIRHPLLFRSTLSKSLGTKSDVARWRERENLKEDWDARTILMASLIPADSDVLEFGAARLVLREHLQKNCTYQPSDIVDRGDATIICDLNSGFPPLPRRYTHTVFSGVLEYLSDIGATVDALRDHTEVIVASYQTIDRLPDYVTRRLHGWINHLSNDQLVALFKQHGFNLTKTYTWHLQTIYVFENAA